MCSSVPENKRKGAFPTAPATFCLSQMKARKLSFWKKKRQILGLSDHLTNDYCSHRTELTTINYFRLGEVFYWQPISRTVSSCKTETYIH
jgi:hypothetical protein